MRRRQTVTEKQALSRIFEIKKKVAQWRWRVSICPKVVGVIRQDKQHVYEK
jgi:hypothetical protein